MLLPLLLVFPASAAGSFAFGDADYAKNMQLGGQQGEWQQSLWVLTQVKIIFNSSLYHL
jgi:hypothetical protein